MLTLERAILAQIEVMTINGGQPHQVGYRGQAFKVTVYDDSIQRRRVICWTGERAKQTLLISLELRPGWSDAKCEEVKNGATGDTEMYFRGDTED